MAENNENTAETKKKGGFKIPFLNFGSLFAGKRQEEPSEAEEQSDEEEKPASVKKVVSFDMLKRIMSNQDYNYEENVEPGNEVKTFEEIFKITKIPAKGPSIDKIVEYLDSDFIRNIPDMKSKSEEILKKIAMDKISKQELFDDAIRKDKALDTYEDFIVSRMKRFYKKTVEEMNALKKELEEKNAAYQKVYEDCNKWLAEKSDYERRLADACEALGDRSQMTEGFVTQNCYGRNQNDPNLKK